MAQPNETETFENESKRIRNLTTPAQEEYEQRVFRFTKQLSDIKRDIDEVGTCFDSSKDDLSSLSSIKEFVKSCEKAYMELSNKFLAYLKSVRSYESENEESSHRLIRETTLCN